MAGKLNFWGLVVTHTFHCSGFSGRVRLAVFSDRFTLSFCQPVLSFLHLHTESKSVYQLFDIHSFGIRSMADCCIIYNGSFEREFDGGDGTTRSDFFNHLGWVFGSLRFFSLLPNSTGKAPKWL
ncbi:hypothetical protein MADA3029_510132 [Vibrio nigripulchritudo MADA3029]|nr:hypothetical protein VIBNIMADA3020_750132 [Vibrio nigripulchritudo MADA3020]CCN60044.1 hypothetical protein MADA3029_510132 [Vibrio nigripulchritudo MADA3029]